MKYNLLSETDAGICLLNYKTWSIECIEFLKIYPLTEIYSMVWKLIKMNKTYVIMDILLRVQKRLFWNCPSSA